MKIMPRNIAINVSLAIATGFMTMNALAFEYLGLKSGMTRTEIAQLPGWGNKKKTDLVSYNQRKPREAIWGDNSSVAPYIRLNFTNQTERLVGLKLFYNITGRESTYDLLAKEIVLERLSRQLGGTGEVEQEQNFNAEYASGNYNRYAINILDTDVVDQEVQLELKKYQSLFD